MYIITIYEPALNQQSGRVYLECANRNPLVKGASDELDY
jgi:hypothetical protein